MASHLSLACLLCLVLGSNALQVANQPASGVSSGYARYNMLAAMTSNTSQPNPFLGEKAFDCKEHPTMCKEPFNCQTHSESRSTIAYGLAGMASTGHGNPRAWCGEGASYDHYVTQCLQTKDLKKAGQIQYKETIEGKFGKDTAEADGSYCFIDGHCTNKDVTEHTTLAEADEMCNKRYGRAWWNFGALLTPPQDKIGFGGTDHMENGFQGGWQTRPFLLAACAMGNYHCDVIYCQETYCKTDYYVKKYGHFLKDNKWDKGEFVKKHMDKMGKDISKDETTKDEKDEKSKKTTKKHHAKKHHGHVDDGN